MNTEPGTKGFMGIPIAARFLDHITKAPSGCWEWTGNRRHGYGTIWRDGRREQTHRLLWEWEHGPIPKGQHVLHRCDNPPCCNPRHLFLGTPAINAADRETKGRGRTKRGEACCLARLTEEQVLAIRASALPTYVLARELGVGRQTVYRVRAGVSWQHLLKPVALKEKTP